MWLGCWKGPSDKAPDAKYKTVALQWPTSDADPHPVSWGRSPRLRRPTGHTRRSQALHSAIPAMAPAEECGERPLGPARADARRRRPRAGGSLPAPTTNRAARAAEGGDMTACRFCGHTTLRFRGRDRAAAFALASHIVQEVALEHTVPLAAMQGRRRWAPLVEARRCAARRLQNELALPLKAIGFLLGGRHHSTIINLLRPKNGEIP